MSIQLKNVSTANKSNCKNTSCSATTANHLTSAQREYEVYKEHLIHLVEIVRPSDSLLDYKLKHLIEVIKDNLDGLHDEINHEEPRRLLLERSNKVMALFEMLKDLLPQSDCYFEQVNETCNHVNDFINSKIM